MVAEGVTIADKLREFAEKTPEKAFFISPETGRVVSWRHLAAALAPVAALAQSLRVAAGEPLAFMLNNGWTTVQLLLGGWCSGRVLLPLNPMAGDAQIAYALKQSGCRAVVTDEKYQKRLRAITEDNAAIEIAIVSADGIEMPAAADLSETAAAPRALLMYTSGTTGMPKGVVHTQGSLLAGASNVVTAHRLTAEDRTLCVLPLYHINALCVSVLAPFLSGGSIVMPERFRTEQFWHWVESHECTWFSVVPTLVSYLLHAEAEPSAMPQLRFGRSASAPLPSAVHQAFEERFDIPLIETMGLTETAAQILSNPLPPAERKSGSPGIAYGNAVKVVAPDGSECADEQIGELIVQGANVMCEYNDNPEETADAFTKEGWLRTGDLGYRDRDGYFFITGRRKELIIKGGENIAPREIDEALLQLPQVVDAAAFACPCERYGQRIEACVTMKDGEMLSEAEIIRHCEKVIGKFKSPDRVYFMPDLPRGPSGKVQRLKLAALVSAANKTVN